MTVLSQLRLSTNSGALKLFELQILPTHLLADLRGAFTDTVKLKGDVASGGEAVMYICHRHTVKPRLKVIAIRNDTEVVPVLRFESILGCLIFSRGVEKTAATFFV